MNAPVMEPVHAAELAVLRNVFWQEPLQLPENTDYAALTQEFLLQSVSELVSGADWPAELPASVRDFYEYRALRQGTVFFRYCHVQTQLLDLLEAQQIPAAILKGTAAALSYPNPELRYLGDIDFIVPEAHFEEAFELLQRNGYVLSCPLTEDNKHASFDRAGFHFELHRRFEAGGDPAHQAAMARQIADGLAHRVTGTYQGVAFPMLPPLQNGLILLAHVAQHISGSEGIGLRRVLDWMLYVHRWLDDAFWEAEFCAAARELGLEKLAIVLTQLCRDYLGLPDELRWCGEETADSPAGELLLYFLQSGDRVCRGDQTSRNARLHMLQLRRSGLKGRYRHLRDAGLHHWKAAETHPWLRHFAWIYGGGYYFAALCKNHHGVKKLLQDASAVSDRHAFLKSLGL